REQAEKFGLEFDFSYNDGFPETANHKESANKIRHVANKQELELVELNEAFRGSEDFGHFTKLTKGAIVSLAMEKIIQMYIRMNLIFVMNLSKLASNYSKG